MTLVTKISRLLSKDKIQRVCYGFAAILWFFMFFDTLKYLNAVSSIGIKYIWLTFVPIALLTAQVIFNSKAIWFIICGLVASFTAYAITVFIIGLIDRSNDPLKPLTLDISDIFLVLIYFSFLATIDWTVFHLRPRK